MDWTKIDALIDTPEDVARREKQREREEHSRRMEALLATLRQTRQQVMTDLNQLHSKLTQRGQQADFQFNSDLSEFSLAIGADSFRVHAQNAEKISLGIVATRGIEVQLVPHTGSGPDAWARIDSDGRRIPLHWPTLFEDSLTRWLSAVLGGSTT